MTYLSDSYVNDSQDIPLYDGLTMTGIMEALEKAPQSHAEARTARRGVPVWAVACLWLGTVLVALGLLLTDQVAWMVWSWLH